MNIGYEYYRIEYAGRCCSPHEASSATPHRVRRGKVLRARGRKALRALWQKDVAAVQEGAKNTLALRAFNAGLLEDARLSVSIVPIGDGMALCRRK